MIATGRAARQVPGGLFRTFVGPRCLPAPAREEAEQREHEDHDEDDPEDAHAISCLPVPVDCRRARSDSAWDQRENPRHGYVTGSVTRVAAATGSSPKVHQPSAHRPLGPHRRSSFLRHRLDSATGDAQNLARAGDLPRSDSSLRVVQPQRGLRLGRGRGAPACGHRRRPPAPAPCLVEDPSPL
jgi:hypothetical protein